MIETISSNIRWVSLFSVLIPFILFIWRFGRLNKNQKLLGLLVVLAVVTDGLSFYWGAIERKPNMWLIVLYGVFEFGLLALIFWPHLKKLYDKRLYFGVVGIFLVVFIGSATYNASAISYNSPFKAVGSILMMMLALSFFYENLRRSNQRRLETRPIFWISAAVLIYFSGSLFIFGFNDFVQGNMTLLFTIWGIHGILNTLHNIFYAVALWKDGNEKEIQPWQSIVKDHSDSSRIQV